MNNINFNSGTISLQNLTILVERFYLRKTNKIGGIRLIYKQEILRMDKLDLKYYQIKFLS